MHWLKPILLLALIAFPAQMAQMALSPADELLQEYAQRVRQDARVGEQVSLTDEMFSKMRETFKEYPAICSKPHIKAVSASSVPFGQEDWEAVAIAGRGMCYCTMIGNCRMWIYRIKNGKMHKIFQTEEAAAFGFVRSRSGTPLLIVWTRESAVEKFAVVYKLDYGEFLEAASWKEVYEYQDEHEEYRVHDTPKIYSTMPLGVFLPY
ncbi:MAG TPA: hypothetical protein VGH37_19920 [Candidatus Acidoferrum sp.]|jgi:hypothetical protein